MGIVESRLENLEQENRYLELAYENQQLEELVAKKEFEKSSGVKNPLAFPSQPVSPAETISTRVAQDNIAPPQEPLALFGYDTPAQYETQEEDAQTKEARALGEELYDGGITQSLTPKELAYLREKGTLPEGFGATPLRFARTMYEQTGIPEVGRQIGGMIAGEEQAVRAGRKVQQEIEALRNAPTEEQRNLEFAKNQLMREQAISGQGASMPEIEDLGEIDDRSKLQKVKDFASVAAPEMAEMIISDLPLWILGGGVVKSLSKMPKLSKNLIEAGKQLDMDIKALSEAEKLRLLKIVGDKPGYTPNILGKGVAKLDALPKSVKAGAKFAGDVGVLSGTRAITEGEMPEPMEVGLDAALVGTIHALRNVVKSKAKVESKPTPEAVGEPKAIDLTDELKDYTPEPTVSVGSPPQRSMAGEVRVKIEPTPMQRRTTKDLVTSPEDIHTLSIKRSPQEQKIVSELSKNELIGDDVVIRYIKPEQKFMSREELDDAGYLNLPEGMVDVKGYYKPGEAGEQSEIVIMDKGDYSSDAGQMVEEGTHRVQAKIRELMNTPQKGQFTELTRRTDEWAEAVKKHAYSQDIEIPIGENNDELVAQALRGQLGLAGKSKEAQDVSQLIKMPESLMNDWVELLGSKDTFKATTKKEQAIQIAPTDVASKRRSLKKFKEENPNATPAQLKKHLKSMESSYDYEEPGFVKWRNELPETSRSEDIETDFVNYKIGEVKTAEGELDFKREAELQKEEQRKAIKAFKKKNPKATNEEVKKHLDGLQVVDAPFDAKDDISKLAQQQMVKSRGKSKDVSKEFADPFDRNLDNKAFNYKHPLMKKTANGKDYRITQGEGMSQNWVLYEDGKVIYSGKSSDDVKDYAKTFISKSPEKFIAKEAKSGTQKPFDRKNVDVGDDVLRLDADLKEMSKDMNPISLDSFNKKADALRKLNLLLKKESNNDVVNLNTIEKINKAINKTKTDLHNIYGETEGYKLIDNQKAISDYDNWNDMVEQLNIDGQVTKGTIQKMANYIKLNQGKLNKARKNEKIHGKETRHEVGEHLPGFGEYAQSTDEIAANISEVRKIDFTENDLMKILQEMPLKPKKPKPYVQSEKFDDFVKPYKKPDIKYSIETLGSEDKSKFTKYVDRYIEPISSTLKKIDPGLKSSIREYAFLTGIHRQRLLVKARGFIKGIRKMSEGDREDLSVALFTGNKEATNKIVAKNGLQKEWDVVEDMLADIFMDSKIAGLRIGFVEQYYPRRVKDPKGLMEYLGRDVKTQMEEIIAAKEKQVGHKLSDEELAKVINVLVSGKSLNGQRIYDSQNLKRRGIEKFDKNMLKFYEKPEKSLVTYIESIVESIGKRNFFGSHIKEADGSVDISESIGNVLSKKVRSGEVTKEQLDKVKEILNAFFKEKSSGKIISSLRDIIYITTMGTLTAPLTQIGDLSFSIAENGVAKTTMGLLKQLPKQDRVVLEDVGISDISYEFTDRSPLSKATNVIFTANGLRAFDRVFKQTNLTATFDKYKAMANSNPKQLEKELQDIYAHRPEDAKKAVADYKAGNKNPTTLFPVFYKLLETNPVAKTEQTLTQLSSPSAKMFYVLKSFMLKQFDFTRRLIMDEIKNAKTKEDKVKGAKKLARWVASAGVLFGVSEYGKDKISNRKTDFGEKYTDFILKLLGFSLYEARSASKDGVIETGVKKALPPLTPFQDFGFDAKNLFEISQDEEKKFGDFIKESKFIRRAPIAGKVYYDWFGRGKSTNEYFEDQKYLELPSDVDDKSAEKARGMVKGYLSKAKKIEDPVRRKEAVNSTKEAWQRYLKRRRDEK